MDLMSTSSGTLSSSYAEYMDSMEAHIASFKAAFAELGSNVIDSDVVKFFVDIGQAMLNTLNVLTQLINTVGGLKTVLVAVGAAIGIAKADKITSTLTKVINIAKRFFSAIDSGAQRIQTIVSINSTFASSVNALTAAQETNTQATLLNTVANNALSVAHGIQLGTVNTLATAYEMLTANMSAAQVAMLDLILVAGAVYGVAKLYDALTVSFDELCESADDAREKLSSTESSIDEIRTSAESLATEYEITFTDGDTAQEIIDKINEATEPKLGVDSDYDDKKLAAIKAETAALEAQLVVQESLLEVERQEAAEAASEVLTSGHTKNVKTSGTGTDVSYESVDIVTETYDLQSQIVELNKELTNYYKQQKEYVEEGKEDTKEYRSLTTKINSLEQKKVKLTKKFSDNYSTISKNAKSLLDSDGKALDGYGELVEKIQGLDSAILDAKESEDALDSSVNHTAKSLTSEAEAANSFVEKITSLKTILGEQTTGSVISTEDYENLSEYSSALEYHNGVMQYNVEKCNAITKALAEEEKAQLAVNKASSQNDYLENAKKIQEYRNKLSQLGDTETETRELLQEKIDTLRDENSAIVDNIKEYDLMIDSIDQATSAYQNFINAQSAESSGKMFSGALEAFQTINDTLNNAESDIFGRVGEADFKAALDFVIPDSVDTDDENAINAYLAQVQQYLTFDDDGNYEGLDIDKFCRQAVEAGLMVVNEAGTDYVVAGEKTMEDFAEGLNMSLPLVQAIFGEMESFGGEFSWADEATKTVGDLAVEANEAYESLQELDAFKDLRLNLDVSDYENETLAIEELDKNIKQMQDAKATMNLDSSQVQEANSIIQYCLVQKQLLSQPEVMEIDTSKAASEYQEILELVQEFQNALNTKEMQAAIGADTTEADAQIDAVVAKINNADPEIKAKIGLSDNATADSLKAQVGQITIDGLLKINAVDKTAIASYEGEEETKDGKVVWKNETSVVDAYKAIEQQADGKVVWHNDTADLTTSFEAYGTVYWSGSGGKPDSVNGTAHAAGTAMAKGDWGTATGGETLVGELGEEIVVLNSHLAQRCA